MRHFLNTLGLILTTMIVTATISSGVWLYFLVKFIEKDPIFKEAKTIITERKYNEK